MVKLSLANRVYAKNPYQLDKRGEVRQIVPCSWSAEPFSGYDVNEKCLSSRNGMDSMKDGLLTDRQMEVLRYRKQGMTQQQIADIISTSKANVCTIEKSAMENIRRAKETLEFLYTLDATHLCTIPSGTDLFEVPGMIFAEAEKAKIKVKYDTISLINRLREARPQSYKARCICEDVQIYITDEGEIYFG
jgi:hypothetical protein